MLRKILEFGLIAAVMLSVGGFGGTEPLSWGASQALILLSGLLLVALPSGNQTRHEQKLLLFPLALGAWVAVQWLASRAGRIGFDAHATPVVIPELTRAALGEQDGHILVRPRGWHRVGAEQEQDADRRGGARRAH